MLYRVIKGAFGPDVISGIEEIVAALPPERGATTKREHSTRRCEVRWISHGTPGYDFARKRLVAALAAGGIEESPEWALENVQYTAYGPGEAFDWHIDAYNRTYNKYDRALDRRFLGKKRKLSISVLLNGPESFTGGAFEVSMFPNGPKTVGAALEGFTEAGDLAVFDSGLCHRVAPIESGLRKSLVAWICA